MEPIKLKAVVMYVPEDLDVASLTVVRAVQEEDETYHNEIMTGCFSNKAESFNIMNGTEYELTETGDWMPITYIDEDEDEND